MATLGEIYRVSPHLHGNNVQTDGSNNEDINVFTIDKSRIVVFKVQDQRVMKDWMIGADQLSCPAVIYGKPMQLSVLLQNSTICTWGESESRIEKGTKKTTSKAGYGLWCPSDRSVPYVIYVDGSVASVDDPNTLVLKQQFSSSLNVIIWRGQVKEGHCQILCLLCKDKKNQMTCLVYQWHKEGDNVICVKHTVADKGQMHISYSICYHMQRLYIFLLDVSGELQRCCLLGKADTLTISLGHIPHITRSAAILALDDHQVVVAGITEEKEIVGIGTWDAKYSLLHSFKPMKEVEEPSCLYRFGRKLFIICSAGTYACSCTSYTPTLTTAVGTLVGRECIDKSLPLHDVKETQEHVESLATWLKSLTPEDLAVHQPELTALIQQIAREVCFWSGTTILDDLIKKRLISGSHLELLIPALIEQKETKLIHLLLQAVSHVPEVIVIQTLEYFIRTSLKSEPDDFRQAGNLSDVLPIFTEEDAVYVNTVLTLPFNESFITEYLQQMDLSYVIRLLKHLTYLLSWTSSVQETAKDKSVPALPRVFDWCSVCLDCHSSQLVMSADAKPIILKLIDQLQNQMNFYMELDSLESIIHKLKEKITQKPKHGAQHYCITKLHVK